MRVLCILRFAFCVLRFVRFAFWLRFAFLRFAFWCILRCCVLRSCPIHFIWSLLRCFHFAPMLFRLDVAFRAFCVLCVVHFAFCVFCVCILHFVRFAFWVRFAFYLHTCTAFCVLRFAFCILCFPLLFTAFQLKMQQACILRQHRFRL